MHALYLPLSYPTGWKLTPISPGNLAHGFLSSDFLTYLVFWLPLACSLPLGRLWRLSPLLLVTTSSPACRAPLGLRSSSLPHLPPHLVSARFSQQKLKMLKELSKACAHSSGFLSPGRPKTQRNMQPWDRGQRKKREVDLGKKYSLPQLN